uniref:Nuclear transcription factor Y subunit n=1 Tax=Antirrhinum majus TaxID=4151 RepID=A5PGU1_ANTMA|nr:YA2 [Antirrhinum majus]
MKSDKNSNKTSASFQWFRTNQPQFSLSKTVTTELETAAESHFHLKDSDFPYQEPDSSSTLSTEQSHSEATTLARSNLNMQNISFQPGFYGTHKKNGEDSVKLGMPFGSADYMSHHIQLEHNQSPACMSYPPAASYFGGIIASYGPNSIVYPQMVGIAQERGVLPLDCTEGPIYVNAKQYHAILRRRQTRAKLEARSKMAKSKKPYLHESRHLHALKRARGTGGRFLNTKTTQQAKPPGPTQHKNLSFQKINGDAYEPEFQNSESTCSDVSDIFNSDDIFQQPEFTDSISSFPTVHARARIRAGT